VFQLTFFCILEKFVWAMGWFGKTEDRVFKAVTLSLYRMQKHILEVFMCPVNGITIWCTSEGLQERLNLPFIYFFWGYVLTTITGWLQGKSKAQGFCAGSTRSCLSFFFLYQG
jgi:hypothetical protein